jgi:TP901-1 family phage major tail protein
MSAQRGGDMLLKIKNDDAEYVTVAGLRTKTLRLNARPVDVTDTASQGWKELLPGAGMRMAEISGKGVFRDAASDALIRSSFFDQSAQECRFIIPGFGMIDGAFLITGLNYAGSYNGEAQFEISLVSAAVPEFTAL